eukprot:CAMPEP_0173263602 /NCGR_PEP_ID=MMETSP1142-20121109/27475_1 /TAXON_ID=483371 /ORGANISM="non described non described, Strain CCMP2298" /LENGTH=55 /DNA_ID=CAMNT_0014198977 /DNA_START=1 /DNA_END=165 /DNA_ORIENTATION=-
MSQYLPVGKEGESERMREREEEGKEGEKEGRREAGGAFSLPWKTTRSNVSSRMRF